MKKKLSLFCVVLMLLNVFACFCSALAASYTINMDVDFEVNLIFSTYDVDVYLDTNKIGTYDHGKDFKVSFDAEDGNHTIWFYKHNDQSKSGSIKFEVNSDTSIKCHIACHSSEVTVSDVMIDRDTASQTRSMADPEEEDTQLMEEEAAPEQEESAGDTEETTESEAPADSGDGVWISFDTATDEELEEAIDKIKAEQRARLKTKIVLSKTSLKVGKGKTEKLEVSVEGLPEDVTAGKITAVTSDKSVATVQNNTIKGVGNGNAVITFTSVLSDGTEITEECKVEVITVIKSLTAKQKNADIGVGDSYEPEFTIAPADASVTTLSYSTSDSSVAKIDSHGKVHAVGIGKATITATTTDGSDLSASITISATKKDDRGKTLINSDGVSLTVVGFKQTDGSGYSKAEAGNTFVIIELQIENNSSREISVNSLFGFDAYCDDYSVDYSFNADMNTKNELSTTDLAPGRKLKGNKGFEVPKNWKELRVVFTPDASLLGSGEKIEFVLYNDK